MGVDIDVIRMNVTVLNACGKRFLPIFYGKNSNHIYQMIASFHSGDTQLATKNRVKLVEAITLTQQSINC